MEEMKKNVHQRLRRVPVWTISAQPAQPVETREFVSGMKVAKVLVKVVVMYALVVHSMMGRKWAINVL